MPATPIAPPKTRWQKADENFRLQIRRLMAEMGTTTKELVAKEAGMEYRTFCKKYQNPGSLLKREERQIASVFERYGLHYDPTMGEGVTA